MEKLKRKDYLEIVAALVYAHDIYAYGPNTQKRIIPTLRAVVVRLRNDVGHPYVVRALQIIAEDSQRVWETKQKVLASLAQNPEVVHSTIAD